MKNKTVDILQSPILSGDLHLLVSLTHTKAIYSVQFTCIIKVRGRIIFI